MPKARVVASSSSGALSRLPANFYASPAVIAGGAVVVVLYAFVLFAVLSDMKKKELAARAEREANPVAIHEPLIALPERTSPAAATSSSTVKKDDPAPATKAASAERTTVAGSTAPKSATEPVVTKAMPEPSKSAVPPAPAPTAVAVAGPTTKNVVTPTSVQGIGTWFDPDKDCEFRTDGPIVTIKIPGSAHVNSVQLQKTNAPRIMSEVTGDFVVHVRIPDRIQPGSQPLEGLPFTYQGAGLLLWQDEGNYLRLERGSASSSEHPTTHQLLMETRRDGKPGIPAYIEIRDKPVTLRAERRGSEISCTYNSDGKTWIPVKSSALGFGSKVSVGISASNVSPKAFSPRFEEFNVDRGSAKQGRTKKN